MRKTLRSVLFCVFFVAIGVVTTSARPSRASAVTADSLDPTPAPSSMLLVGAGLMVLGGILRRRLRTQVPVKPYKNVTVPGVVETSEM